MSGVSLGFDCIFDFGEVATFQVLIESIFDLSNRSTNEWARHLADGGPFLANSALHGEQEIILLASPGAAHN